MSVVRIDALCECENPLCGKRFGVELELASDLKEGPHVDFDAMVRDEVMGGNAVCYTWGVRGKMTVDRLSLSCHPTIQAGKLLCDECTKKADAYPEDWNE